MNLNVKIFSNTYIRLEDIYLAYRKAKSDSFYDSFHSNAIAYSEFESNIKGNLELLFNKITNEDSKWWEDVNLIGGYRFTPKSLDDEIWNNKDNIYYRSVDPMLDWEQRFKNNGNKRLTPEYRLIQCPTVEYQVISALWILKVGHKYEEKLDRNLSYGNRLRRKEQDFDYFKELNGPINEDSIGLFYPYFSAYKKWRNDGLNSMRELINEGCSVTAVTMDLERFYHNVSPDFILRPSFIKSIGVELTSDDRKFTNLFVRSIKAWCESIEEIETPSSNENKNGISLPVGLSASKVISNILLYELDEQIKNGLNPKYYGRYVDDIFLVFESPDIKLDGNAILSFISKNVECVKLERTKGLHPDINLRFQYAFDSVLKFKAAKQKIFNLSGNHGLDFIDQISSQIKEQSSEYRMLPELPRDSVEMANKTLLASPNAALIADALRKADVVSVRRLGISLLLRDIESYSADLSSSNWDSVRKEFYGLVERYLITPKGIFDLSGYLHRAFRLMVVNNDFDNTYDFILKLDKCFDLIRRTSEISGAYQFSSCKKYLYERLYESAIQSSTANGFRQWEKLRKTLASISLLGELGFSKTKNELRQISESILFSDFGYRSYKDYWYYSQKDNVVKTAFSRAVGVSKVLRINLIEKFRESAQLKSPHWPALVFPTRPLTIQEIALICPLVLHDNELFRQSILGLRGAGTFEFGSIGFSRAIDDSLSMNVSSSTSRKVFIALTNYETTDIQYKTALSGKFDESLERYEKINKLINEILTSGHPVDYVVFPECSLPLRWAVNIAQKLAKQKISLIAGLEYYKNDKLGNVLRNDSLISLSTSWPGYNSNVLILQPKHSASHEEKKTLKSKRLKLHSPKISDGDFFPIYKHGEFHFGVILCSDLTNPANRMRFQGMIDCLFVMEWNPDVKTFSFLVEGAAHDIHSFVVQVNNRTYGDSRVRAPYRIDYKRDSVRVKGGLSDTYVIAEIDFEILRKFQKRGVMTDKKSEFKPVPIGFKMCKTRS